MNFNIDIAIIIAFLIINLAAGIHSGKNIKTIREYAIGNRNFSTAVITATIIATWIGGSDFAIILSEVYKNGLWFILPGVGGAVNLMIVAFIFSKGIKIKEFTESISVAEAMGKLYGKHVRLITAISSIAASIAVIALQIKVFAIIFSYFLGVSSIYATLASSFVVIIYSALGGIKSVTFTDAIQFITFGIVIPVFAIFIWQVLGNSEKIDQALTNSIFDYHTLDFKSDFLPYFSMFLCTMIPMINPTMFQRMLMAKNVAQIRQSFFISSLICLAIILITCFIAFVIFAHDSTLQPNDLAMYVIDQYSVTGVRGLAIIGIMAMIMSTTDSWINASAVIFSHDLCKPLGIKGDELLLSRIFAVLVGFGAVMVSFTSDYLLALSFLERNVYLTIVTAPLMLAILGFRSTPRVVLAAMSLGFFTVIIWKQYIQPITDIESAVPGLIANFITLFFLHYLLGEPGGWVERKNNSLQMSQKYGTFRKSGFALYNFSLVDYCKKYIPKNEMVYIYFGFSVMMTTITTFLLERPIYLQNIVLINTLQAMALFIGIIFISHKLWPANFKEKYIGLIYTLSVFVGLAYVSSFLALLSKFSQVSLVIFILNLAIIGILMSWEITLIMVVAGISSALFCYQFFMEDTSGIAEELYALKLKVIYIALMVGGFLLAFLKPKQEYQALTEEQKNHLELMMRDREVELSKLQDLKHEFLRNLQHEVNTPLTGITSLGPALLDGFDSLTSEQIKKYVETMVASSERYSSLAKNLLNLSHLSSLTYRLNKTRVNLSELIESRMDYCRKLYLGNKELEFVTEIDSDIVIEGDGHYITSALDNLIINAIKYSDKGTITLKLCKKETSRVEFQIIDEGIGIPKPELYDIFGAFVVSSKTRTPSGGRGIGLALCKKIADVHGGSIRAESDGEKGAAFILELPA